jgi:predicted extracellular nuclease
VSSSVLTKPTLSRYALSILSFGRYAHFFLQAFAKSILDIDKNANIIVSGDWNEYLQTSSVYKSITSVLTDIDELAGIPPVERYTYVFDGNTQALDHVFVSKAIAGRKVVRILPNCVIRNVLICMDEQEAEHIHVNNWSPNYESRISDHDPTVARVRLC